MSNKQRKRNFTPSDDTLIREQPVTGIGLNTLETILRISRDTLMRRADELRVTLLVSDDRDGAIDTRSSAVPRDSSIRYWND